jgi:transposase-like protein
VAVGRALPLDEAGRGRLSSGPAAPPPGGVVPQGTGWLESAHTFGLTPVRDRRRDRSGPPDQPHPVPANDAEYGEKTVTFGNTSPQQQTEPFRIPSATDHGRRCYDINRLTDWAGIEKTYLKVRGRWCYLYRAVDRDGNLIDAMLNEHRDMKSAQAFLRWAKATMGFRPDRVTTDGHGSYPRAIRSVLGKTVRHRTSAYLNNHLEQDHRGIKGRSRCMRGFQSHDAADRFCREHGELRNLLRPRRRHNQIVSASSRRSRFSKGARIALNIMQNA